MDTVIGQVRKMWGGDTEAETLARNLEFHARQIRAWGTSRPSLHSNLARLCAMVEHAPQQAAKFAIDLCQARTEACLGVILAASDASPAEISRVMSTIGHRSKGVPRGETSRENGRKGGAPRNWYVVISGEGEIGTLEAAHTTGRGIQMRLARERSGGDRWARAYELDLSGPLTHPCCAGQYAGVDSDGDQRSWDADYLRGLGVPIPE